MSKSSERSEFEKKFADDVIEVSAVTGPSGVGAGKAGTDIYWNASIDLIAWRNLHSSGPVVKEELSLEWLVDDEELKKSREILKENTVVRLKVRKGQKSMMLVEVLDTEYKDSDLEIILQESIKPVFYNDENLGEFKLDKSTKLFEKKISWGGEEGNLYFDWDKNEDIMKSSLKSAHGLLKEQDSWNTKIRNYAAEELVELANEWLQDDEEADIDEITKEMFIDLMELDSISVYPEGDFEVFFFDGDMFWGHSIIVTGNISGELSSAEIAG